MIVGNREVVDGVLTCMLAGSHALLEGVPGLGKTMLGRTLAEALHLNFSRVQFTPDMMPADIIGTDGHRRETRAVRRASASARGRSSRTSCSPTRSTAPRRRRRASLLEGCRAPRDGCGGRLTCSRSPSSSSRPRNPRSESEGTYPCGSAARSLLLQAPRRLPQSRRAERDPRADDPGHRDGRR